jgi:hypothetical protein
MTTKAAVDISMSINDVIVGLDGAKARALDPKRTKPVL